MSTSPTVEQIMSYPPLAEALKFIEELRKESPRGRVLIAAGFIEQQLRDVLAAFLSTETDLATLLDGASAPLGTFRRRPTIIASWRDPGRDGVVPLGMERVSLDIKAGHLLVTDLDPLGVGPRIEFASHR